MIALALAGCRPAATAAPDITVEEAWAQPTLPGSSASAAYLTIRNRGAAADSLVVVTSGGASVSLHSTTMDGGIMRMRPLERLEISPGATVRLEPGGTHLMLGGLSKGLAPGDSVPLRLRFARSGERTVSAQVRPRHGEQM